MQVQQFALTFPKTEVTPTQALQRIMERPAIVSVGVKYCVISQEMHADGTPHLHVFLMLNSPFRYQKHEGNTWDYVVGKRGNYQRMKFPAKWLVYVTKDNKYVTYPADFDVKAFIVSRTKKTSYQKEKVATAILDGQREIFEIVKEYPGFCLINQRKVREFIDLCNDQSAQTSPSLMFPDVLETDTISEKELGILRWLVSTHRGQFNESNMVHMRIQGPTGIGKTRLIHAMHSYFKLYSVVYETTWWDSFSEDRADIIVFDEYKSQKPIQLLNRLADGKGVPLPRRGVRPLILTKRVPILICTNYTWEESYFNVNTNCPQVIAAAKRRFLDVVFESFEDLIDLCKLLENWISDAN